MKRGRRWLGGTALAVLAACVGVQLLTWDVDFVPDIVANHKFRKMKVTEGGWETLVSYTSEEPYHAIRADALREFRRKGYDAEEGKNGEVLFVRAKMVKAVLLPGMRYDTEGNLLSDPRATSMWTASSTSFWIRLEQRLNLRL